MKKNLAITIFLASSLFLFGQNGFNKLYEMDATGSGFQNILHSNDTLIVYGTRVNPDVPGQWGIVLVRMDTTGKIFDFVSEFDSTGNTHVLEQNVGIIKLQNGKYAGVGSLFYDAKTLLAIFDQNGQIEYTKTYNDTTVFQAWQGNIMELDDGFLVSGYKSKQDYFLDGYIMKTDSLGNVLWEQSYNNPDGHVVIFSIVKINDNLFAVGGAKYSSNSIPIVNRWSKSWIFGIDSLGWMKWAWTGPGTNSELHCSNLTLTDNGDWLYCSSSREPDPLGGFLFSPKIIRRDSAMNLLWELEAPAMPTGVNGYIDIKPTPDGNWVAAGQWAPIDNDDENPWYGGCLHKFTDEGETIWSRCDTVKWDTPVDVDRYFMGGITVLPSGSIIAAARADKFSPSPSRSYGWMIKVDKDGCLDTMSCAVTDVFETETPKAEVEVFPNPATELITFRVKPATQENNEAIIAIADVTGKQVKIIRLNSQQGWTYNWDISQMSPGLYFYSVSISSSIAKTGKLIIQH